VNGRFWGSVQLAIDAGVDFPAMLVALALGQEPDPVLTYGTNARLQWEWGEVDHLIAVMRSPRGTAGRFRTALAIAKAFVWHGRTEVFRWTDPAPIVHETIHWFRGWNARRHPR